MRDDRRREVLLAPLRMPTTKWSSRSVAQSLGVSQSRVARAWAPMRRDTAVTTALSNLTGKDPVSLVGVLVRPRYTLLVLQVSSGHGEAGPAGAVVAGSAVERSIQTILAVDLARDRVSPTAPSSEESFWAAVNHLSPGGAPRVAVSSAAAPVPTGLGTAVVCTGREEWLSLLGFLGGSRRHVQPSRAHAAEKALREWFKAPAGDLAWVADPAARATESSPAASRHAARSRSLERTLADQIVATIRTGVSDGRLAGGDQVTERYLATSLRTSRSQIRSATRLLERDGLLTVTAGHAAVIPVPEIADVTETYAARQALGAMVVRAAIRCSPEERTAVKLALDDVRRHAEAGDIYLTGQADTAFQDRIADASGLVRIAPVMHILADHLRVFIAVMGLDYAYPVDAILRDNDAIYAALAAHDADLAARLWRQKMANACTYMVDRLTVTRPRSVPTGGHEHARGPTR